MILHLEQRLISHRYVLSLVYTKSTFFTLIFLIFTNFQCSISFCGTFAENSKILRSSGTLAGIELTKIKNKKNKTSRSSEMYLGSCLTSGMELILLDYLKAFSR